MKEIRREKVAEIIHRLAAEFIRNEATSASLLTITRVEVSPTGKECKIYFTTIPETQEDTALKFLERKIAELKHHIRDNSRLAILPHITWKIDYGERNRQRLDEISQA